ncbi:MAG TPA: gamma carbonic anhydrase family protein [Acidiferrobacteraceae bacterium]|jgi:carbonic anhydrase/acetyltransferase-like protein (isoleucine patch superfamily)|nr:gamma carbonic anhydrase family protein [Acidiferrobacteraceae bacterium]HEX19321.1 gamma carbonic anhydrase family protein [Acidiferrobacteraceae bacterium]
MTIRNYKDISPTIDGTAYIDDAGLVIGDVVIGADCSVWPFAVLRGDINKIRVGNRSNIQDGTVVHVTHPYSEHPQGFAVHIGDDVTIGHNVTVHGCTIHDRCLIGIGSTILDGAIIHADVFLAAGSLVPEGRELESGYLWMGAPVKIKRELSEKEMKWFDYSAQHYVSLKNDYLNK